MRSIVLILCCLAVFISVSAQNIISQITDSNSGLPVQFANIGIVGKNIGTVSDTEGKFQLSLVNVLDTDTLRISMIAYVTKKFNVGEFRKSEFPKKIQMNKNVFQLQEVVVSKQQQASIQLGLKKKYSYPIPLYKGAETKIPFPQKDYRHEIGVRFTNSKIISLDSIQLNFAECNIDNLKLRLNVYAIKDENINNILTKPIYISLSNEDAINLPIINLIEQRINIASDFLVTVENYAQIEDKALYFFANFKSKGKQYPTYYRHSSQSNWVRLKSKKNKVIGLSLLVFVH